MILLLNDVIREEVKEVILLWRSIPIFCNLLLFRRLSVYSEKVLRRCIIIVWPDLEERRGGKDDTVLGIVVLCIRHCPLFSPCFTLLIICCLEGEPVGRHGGGWEYGWWDYSGGRRKHSGEVEDGGPPPCCCLCYLFYCLLWPSTLYLILFPFILLYIIHVLFPYCLDHGLLPLYRALPDLILPIVPCLYIITHLFWFGPLIVVGWFVLIRLMMVSVVTVLLLHTLDPRCSLPSVACYLPFYWLLLWWRYLVAVYSGKFFWYCNSYLFGGYRYLATVPDLTLHDSIHPLVACVWRCGAVPDTLLKHYLWEVEIALMEERGSILKRNDSWRNMCLEDDIEKRDGRGEKCDTMKIERGNIRDEDDEGYDWEAILQSLQCIENTLKVKWEKVIYWRRYDEKLKWKVL